MRNWFRFVYGATGDWTPELPVRPWARRVSTIGGRRKPAAVGVAPASYLVRRDHILLLGVRFFEQEWPEFHDLLEWGQAAELITVWTDPDDEYTAVDCYLDSPAAGEDIAPTRSTEYLPAHELVIGLQRADGGIWDLEYLPLTDE